MNRRRRMFAREGIELQARPSDGNGGLRRMAAHVLVALVVAIAGPTSAPAQSSPLIPAADFWIGKRVITHYGTVLQVGGAVVDDAGRGKALARGKDQSVFRVYEVEHVNGPWLWLAVKGSGIKGWVRAENVIPFDQAVDYFTGLIRANPSGASHYISRGNVWQARKEYDKAIGDYNEAIRLDPGDAHAYNGRAWLWATAPDEKVRDGKRAVESAMRACEIGEWKSPDALDTLAAAHAEVGDFGAAVKWQEKAIGLLDKSSATEIADFRTRLELYRDKKPYRQEPKP